MEQLGAKIIVKGEEQRSTYHTGTSSEAGVTSWGLHWTGLELPTPEAKTHYIEIPGRDGKIDLTDALDGATRYNNRLITMSFSCTDDTSYEQWQEKYSQISSAVHGAAVKVVLDTDPNYYYEGRLTVSSEKSSPVTSDITLVLDAEPYKRSRQSKIMDQYLTYDMDYPETVVNLPKIRRIEYVKITLELIIHPQALALIPKDSWFEMYLFFEGANGRKILNFIRMDPKGTKEERKITVYDSAGADAYHAVQVRDTEPEFVFSAAVTKERLPSQYQPVECPVGLMQPKIIIEYRDGRL